MIGRDFYAEDAESVAKKLLGKILVRKIGSRELRAKIVESEAYFGPEDPASRACKKGDLRATMEMAPGTILVYGVHNNWLINFVTGRQGKAEAVLLRALEPLNFNVRCNGPGLLTKAMKISKVFHKQDICNCKGLRVENGNSGDKFKIGSSKRIGVKKDLTKNLRFFIEGNKFVSRV
ncbi:MAG: DNA-3-methyladenine glycosylase [Candidatus Pacearchaeota archaeon]|nr:DNA-3-methyladenine glycosylase [Candidatus Pacearchaeota archaeon]